MATNLPKLADVERLSPSVVRIMGGNGNKVHHLSSCLIVPNSLVLN
jgi:hypothetical protein